MHLFMDTYILLATWLLYLFVIKFFFLKLSKIIYFNNDVIMLNCNCLSRVYLGTHRVGVTILQDVEIVQLCLQSQKERENNFYLFYSNFTVSSCLLSQRVSRRERGNYGLCC